MTDIISRFIPVFLIIFIGTLLRQRHILSDTISEALKQLIIKVGLPAIFFASFLTIDLQARYLLLFAGTFITCLLLFAAGSMLRKLQIVHYPLSPFFFTGFEFGMVGVALFSSLFGGDNLHYLLLLGLGHEFFIWFLYAPLLGARNQGQVRLIPVLKSFISSPIIIAILSALLLNVTGWYTEVADLFWVRGVIATAKSVGAITTPLILLVIGYHLTLKPTDWRRGLQFLGTRLLLVTVFGTGFYLLTDLLIMDLGTMMRYAFITFFLLPPPFIIPVYIPKQHERESMFYTNLLVLYTIVTLIIYTVVMTVISS